MLDYDPPRRMIRDPRVCDPTALRLYGYLRRNPETTFRRVSIALDLTEQTVRRWIKCFEQLGYVTVKRGYARGTCSRFGFPLETEREETLAAS